MGFEALSKKEYAGQNIITYKLVGKDREGIPFNELVSRTLTKENIRRFKDSNTPEEEKEGIRYNLDTIKSGLKTRIDIKHQDIEKEYKEQCEKIIAIIDLILGGSQAPYNEGSEDELESTKETFITARENDVYKKKGTRMGARNGDQPGSAQKVSEPTAEEVKEQIKTRLAEKRIKEQEAISEIKKDIDAFLEMLKTIKVEELNDLDACRSIFERIKKIANKTYQDMGPKDIFECDDSKQEKSIQTFRKFYNLNSIIEADHFITGSNLFYDEDDSIYNKIHNKIAGLYAINKLEDKHPAMIEAIKFLFKSLDKNEIDDKDTRRLSEYKSMMAILSPPYYNESTIYDLFVVATVALNIRNNADEIEGKRQQLKSRIEELEKIKAEERPWPDTVPSEEDDEIDIGSKEKDPKDHIQKEIDNFMGLLRSDVPSTLSKENTEKIKRDEKLQKEIIEIISNSKNYNKLLISATAVLSDSTIEEFKKIQKIQKGLIDTFKDGIYRPRHLNDLRLSLPFLSEDSKNILKKDARFKERVKTLDKNKYPELFNEFGAEEIDTFSSDTTIPSTQIQPEAGTESTPTPEQSPAPEVQDPRAEANKDKIDAQMVKKIRSMLQESGNELLLNHLTQLSAKDKEKIKSSQEAQHEIFEDILLNRHLYNSNFYSNRLSIVLDFLSEITINKIKDNESIQNKLVECFLENIKMDGNIYYQELQNIENLLSEKSKKELINNKSFQKDIESRPKCHQYLSNLIQKKPEADRESEIIKKLKELEENLRDSRFYFTKEYIDSLNAEVKERIKGDGGMQKLIIEFLIKRPILFGYDIRITESIITSGTIENNEEIQNSLFEDYKNRIKEPYPFSLRFNLRFLSNKTKELLKIDTNFRDQLQAQDRITRETLSELLTDETSAPNPTSTPEPSPTPIPSPAPNPKSSAAASSAPTAAPASTSAPSPAPRANPALQPAPPAPTPETPATATPPATSAPRLQPFSTETTLNQLKTESIQLMFKARATASTLENNIKNNTIATTKEIEEAFDIYRDKISELITNLETIDTGTDAKEKAKTAFITDITRKEEEIFGKNGLKERVLLTLENNKPSVKLQKIIEKCAIPLKSIGEIDREVEAAWKDTEDSTGKGKLEKLPGDKIEDFDLRYTTEIYVLEEILAEINKLLGQRGLEVKIKQRIEHQKEIIGKRIEKTQKSKEKLKKVNFEAKAAKIEKAQKELEEKLVKSAELLKKMKETLNKTVASNDPSWFKNKMRATFVSPHTWQEADSFVEVYRERNELMSKITDDLKSYAKSVYGFGEAINIEGLEGEERKKIEAKFIKMKTDLVKFRRKLNRQESDRFWTYTKGFIKNPKLLAKMTEVKAGDGWNSFMTDMNIRMNPATKKDQEDALDRLNTGAYKKTSIGLFTTLGMVGGGLGFFTALPLALGFSKGVEILDKKNRKQAANEDQFRRSA